MHLKGIPFESVYINLAKDVQSEASYTDVNPSGLVPTLECLKTGQRLTQSVAILEYLDAVHAEPLLVPQDPFEAARVRAFALDIACDIHPIQNRRILKYLMSEYGKTQKDSGAWACHWITQGLKPLEQIASQTTSAFLFGEAPTLAEICLIPQLSNARRFGADMAAFPRLVEIDTRCAELPAFIAAAPVNQPDAE